MVCNSLTCFDRKEIENYNLTGPQATDFARSVLGGAPSQSSLDSGPVEGLSAPPSRRLSGTNSAGLRSRGNSVNTQDRQLAQEVNLLALDDYEPQTAPAAATQSAPLKPAELCMSLYIYSLGFALVRLYGTGFFSSHISSI